MRRGDGSPTTSPSPATRRTSRTCSPRSRSSSSTRSTGTARSGSGTSRLRRGGRRARRDRAARARPARHHALHLYVVRDRPGAGRRDARRVPAGARGREHRDVDPLPARPPAHLLPRAYPAPPLPVAERAGAEVLSLPLSPAHSDDDIGDAIEALRRVHERFADEEPLVASSGRSSSPGSRRLHRLEGRPRAGARILARRRSRGGSSLAVRSCSSPSCRWRGAGRSCSTRGIDDRFPG